MKVNLVKISKIDKNINLIVIANKEVDFAKFDLTEAEIRFAKKSLENELKQIVINQYSRFVIFDILDNTKPENILKESARKAANKTLHFLNSQKADTLVVSSDLDNAAVLLAYTEGLVISGYQFLKYFNETKEKEQTIKNIKIYNDLVTDEQIAELTNLMEGLFITRNFVNEPFNVLNVKNYVHEIQEMANKCGLSADVFDKKKIESLKMGGLLGVNRGSAEPPAFCILEWKPENAKNEQPLVLVGKGIVYDSGGLSLKPTPSSMDYMKCDMAGSAAVCGVMYSVATNKLPVHIIALIPITDNAIGNKALAPGDVIKMHNGKSVEVLNADAEGRLILGDALSYAKKYKPGLVIDLATLTGAAMRAVGIHGIVAMGKVDEKIMMQLKKSGDSVYERIVEFPLWDEYEKGIKSDIADIKNIGPADGGAITAGKFLEHFVDYNWIHLDIATNAFLLSADDYRGKGATGVCVRLLYDFVKSYYLAK